MSKAVFAKSTGAAVVEEEAGEQLETEFSGAMQELDAFVKANTEGSPILAKAKKAEEKMEEEEEEEEEQGEKPHDKDEEDVMAKAEERNLEETTHGQTKKKKTMHAKPMHKAVETEEGEDEIQTFDGEKVIAGFQASLNKVAKSVSILMRRMDEMQAENVKLTVMLAKAVKSEGAVIKAIAGEISEIGHAPRPRKSVLTVFEKSASGSTSKDGDKPAFDGSAFLAKSVEAAAAGRISAVQVGEIRQLINTKQDIPAWLVSRVEGK